MRVAASRSSSVWRHWPRRPPQPWRVRDWPGRSADRLVSGSVPPRAVLYTLNLGWEGRTATVEAFHRLHQKRYGHRLTLPIELVNLWVRVRATGAPPKLILS